jgi:hypothetical protein
MLEPLGSLICIVVVLLSSRIAPGATLYVCLRYVPCGHPHGVTYSRLTTSRPSFQRSPLHRLGSRGAHSRAHVAVLASGIGRQPVPCSAFVVFHHLDGLLLLDPLRILHRSSSLGVRDVSSGTSPLSSSRVPALRSFAPCMQPATRGWRTILAPGPLSPGGYPPVHRGPCPLVLVAWTSRPCSACRALSYKGVATAAGSLLPWACPGLLLHHLEGGSIPALALGVRPRQLSPGWHIRSG